MESVHHLHRAETINGLRLNIYFIQLQFLCTLQHELPIRDGS